MYSRNTWERRNSGYTVPPGYDGSRFRRSRNRHDEVILVPDSGFAVKEDPVREDSELSVSGILTQKGIQSRKCSSADADDASIPDFEGKLCPKDEPEHENKECDPPAKGEKLSGLLSSLGFKDRISSDELLLCAVIFIIASDTENEGRNAGDILLILALLLGIR